MTRDLRYHDWLLRPSKGPALAPRGSRLLGRSAYRAVWPQRSGGQAASFGIGPGSGSDRSELRSNSRARPWELGPRAACSTTAPPRYPYGSSFVGPKARNVYSLRRERRSRLRASVRPEPRLVEGGCFAFEGSSGCLAHRHRCHPGCFVPFDLEFGAHRQRGEAPTRRDRVPPVRLRGTDPVHTRRTDGRRLECRCQLMNHKARGWIRSSPRSGRRANES